MTDTKLVKMRLTPETIAKVERLQVTLQQVNRADTLVCCVNIATKIVELLESGGKLHAIDRDGLADNLVIPILSP